PEAAHASAARRAKASTERANGSAADGGRRRAAAKKPVKGKRLAPKRTRKAAPGRARGLK
ncbi:MAG TPA: hypothetical protein VJ738_11130, partial [Steroidobacteraceae bacterium]|nr:hypothetical protein [Steroidobacteraceae bacterium]